MKDLKGKLAWQPLETKEYGLMRKIVPLIREGKVEVISKERKDKYDWEDKKLDLHKEDTWCTYDKCIKFVFSVNSTDDIVCEVTVWNGDLAYGFPEGIRFIAELKMPTSFLKEIKDSINYNFDDYCEELFEEEEQARKNKRVKEIAKELLGQGD